MEEALVELMMAQPGSAEQIIEEHRNDGSGHCRVCTTGSQAGRHIWPCTLRTCADKATRRIRSARAT
jgi:hypothetical protein